MPVYRFVRRLRRFLKRLQAEESVTWIATRTSTYFYCRAVAKSEPAEVSRLPLVWCCSVGKPGPAGEVDIPTVTGISSILAASQGSSPKDPTN